MPRGTGRGSSRGPGRPAGPPDRERGGDGRPRPGRGSGRRSPTRSWLRRHCTLRAMAARADPDKVPERIRRLGRVHHVAVIVADLDPALRFWRDTLGLELEVVEDITHDRVRIAFLPVGESKIELVEPTDDTTGVARFLAKSGEGFHHVCFEVANLAE